VERAGSGRYEDTAQSLRFRKIVNADGAPLQLHDKDAVDVGYVRDLYELLRAIDEVLPKDAILYVEGTNIAPAVAEFLAARETSEKPAVEPNTIWPKPRVFHLPLSGTNLEEFRALADQHAEPEIADHLVVYRGRDVLLWAHDAGSDHVELSRALPRETLRRFTNSLAHE
jgi:hypothetical protein